MRSGTARALAISALSAALAASAFWALVARAAGTRLRAAVLVAVQLVWVCRRAADALLWRYRA